MTVTSAEENQIHQDLEEAIALVGKAEVHIDAVETAITQGRLPEKERYKLTGCIVSIRTGISGLNNEAANTYPEFRPRKAA